MKLSIIISFYNLHQYVGELLEILDKQMRKEVEVILVDDGSEIPFTSDYKWLKVYRKQNGGVSTARNLGLDYAVGEYITFIDADDIVPDYYLDRL
jgi:glycosyltransferase involved in cell wall biosynthesis